MGMKTEASLSYCRSVAILFQISVLTGNIKSLKEHPDLALLSHQQ